MRAFAHRPGRRPRPPPATRAPRLADRLRDDRRARNERVLGHGPNRACTRTDRDDRCIQLYRSMQPGGSNAGRSFRWLDQSSQSGSDRRACESRDGTVTPLPNARTAPARPAVVRAEHLEP